MEGLTYPLQELLSIKKKRYDAAIKTLEEKKKIHQKQLQELKKREKARDQVLEHKNDKLQQLRTTVDKGTTSDKIQQMKLYLKEVDGKLQEKEEQVKAQAQKEQEAAHQVEIARKDVFAKEKDLEKLKKHREEWEKQAKYWIEQKAATEHDELGSVGFIAKKRKPH